MVSVAASLPAYWIVTAGKKGRTAAARAGQISYTEIVPFVSVHKCGREGCCWFDLLMSLFMFVVVVPIDLAGLFVASLSSIGLYLLESRRKPQQISFYRDGTAAPP